MDTTSKYWTAALDLCASNKLCLVCNAEQGDDTTLCHSISPILNSTFLTAFTCIQHQTGKDKRKSNL